jgi:hypothetical protein
MILASPVISCAPLRLYRSTSAVATPISQPKNEIIDEFVFDAVLYNALRESEKQAAMAAHYCVINPATSERPSK